MRARAIIETETPRRFLKALGKVTPQVTERDQAVLKSQDFLEPEESDGEYVDWRRYVGGFGEDGTDRCETVTWDIRHKRWVASAVHIDQNGDYWYEHVSDGAYHTVDSALQWLEADRQTAPRQARRQEAFRKGSAKRFIMGQGKRLRPGRGWVLSWYGGRSSEHIPVEMLPLNVPNTLDAPYNLGMAVEDALHRQGLNPDEPVDRVEIPGAGEVVLDRHSQEMARYYEPMYLAVKAGETRGVVHGIAGVRQWSLDDEGPEEEPEL